jgi:hypothetical protein
MNKLRRTTIIALVTGLFVLFLDPLQAAARGKGKISKLFGSLTTHQVECQTLCTAGELTGGFSGTLEFTMHTMVETNQPDVSRYEGVNTITTEDGTISGTDYGLWNLVTGEFIDFTVFDQGTGAFAGKSGTLVIVGTFDPVEGVGASDYFAIIH